MKREDYKLNVWYPLTDNEYWIEFGGCQDEFPNCQTIVCDTYPMEWIRHDIMTYHNCPFGWSTMAKSGTYMFMIIEKPNLNNNEQTQK